MLISGCLVAQRLPQHETAIFLGWDKKIDGYHIPTITLERSFQRWSSIQFGFGVNAFPIPRNPDYTKLNTQLNAEVRWYMVLRHHRRLTGLYMGLYVDMNRTRWYYRDLKTIAVRKSWEDAGPCVGYQHALGTHFRFNEGVTAVIQSDIRENSYEIGMAPKQFTIYDAWYTYYFYVRVGIVW